MSNIQATIQFILDDVIAFHEDMETKFVMEKGIHDMNLLESAVNTPFQTFDGTDLYPTIWDKAARLCYGLAKDHPFRDGNKRTALHSMLVFLGVNDISIQSDALAMENIIISIASGSMSAEELSAWLHDNEAVPVTVSIPAWLNSLAVENNVNFSNILQNALMRELDVKKA